MTTEIIHRTRVWDMPTRVFHWTLALSFFGAYLLAESDQARHIHVMFGYTVLALTLFRLLWGFIGTRYARFGSFAFGPRAALEHAAGLARGRAGEHAGHTPAGSWAIWLMLGLALVTAATGWLHLNEVGGEALEEVHEAAANAWLLVVFIHVAGVIVSSIVERRNLPRAMLTGWKTLGTPTDSVRSWSALAVLMLIAVSTFWIATLATQGELVLPSDAVEEKAAMRSLSFDADSDDD